MTEPDLVSDSRPVDDQLDVTQRLTKEQDDQFDTPSASGWKREDEEGMHPDEQEQPAISEVAYQYQPKDFSKVNKGNVEVSSSVENNYTYMYNATNNEVFSKKGRKKKL